MQQIYWWFYNRAHKTQKEAARGKKFKFAPLKSRPLQPYQAYMTLYKETFMSVIADRYTEYKAALPAGEEPQKWWPFCMEQTKKLLEAETAEVKEKVEKERKKKKGEIDWDVIINAEEDEMTAAMLKQVFESQQ